VSKLSSYDLFINFMQDAQNGVTNARQKCQPGHFGSREDYKLAEKKLQQAEGLIRGALELATR
jgi:hypothetical protein